MTDPTTTARAKPSIRQRLLVPWVVMPVVALVGLGGWFALRPDGGGTDTASQLVATDQAVAATVGTMAKTVSSEGTVAASQTDDLSFTSAGTVTAVNVAAGDQVKAGQVLATIDSAELEVDVADAESALADAEATLADDTDAGASDEQLAADEASVTTAQDGLDTAREALDGASLVASFDGTVASVDLTVGEELASGGNGGVDRTGSGSGSGQSAGTLGTGSTSPTGGGDTGSSSAQIQVISTGSFTVELGLDSTDVADVEVGQLASVSLSTSTSTTSNGFPGGFPGGGFPGGGFPGRGNATTTTTQPDAPATTTPTATDTDSVQGLVTKVASVADASSGVATYAVTVAFIDTSGTFNVGATAAVDITYAQVEDAVQVPARAVTTANGASTVTVRKDGQDETRTVTTGLTSGAMVQITSGLAEGEQVVIAFPGRPTQAGGGGTNGSGGAPAGLPGGAAPGGAVVVDGAGG